MVWESVPYVIFKNIAVHCVFHELYRLLHVCKSWRQLMFLCSHYWRTHCDIRLLSYPRVPRSIWPLDAFLHADDDVHVSADVTPAAILATRLSICPDQTDVYASHMLYHHLSRIVSLTASIGEDSRFVIRPSTLAAISSFPRLRDLRLSAGVGPMYPDEHYTFNPDLFTHTKIAPLGAPNLLFLRLDRVSVRWKMIQHPILTHLSLNGNRHTLTLPSLSSLLRNCPSLTDIRLTRVHSVLEEPDASPFVIRAPFLRTCKIETRGAMATFFLRFLSQLECPLLSSISLITGFRVEQDQELFLRFARWLRLYMHPEATDDTQPVQCDLVKIYFPHVGLEYINEPTSIAYVRGDRDVQVGIYTAHNLHPTWHLIFNRALHCGLNSTLYYRVDREIQPTPALPIGRPLRLYIEGSCVIPFFLGLLTVSRLPPVVRITVHRATTLDLPSAPQLVEQPLLTNLHISSTSGIADITDSLAAWIRTMYPSVTCVY
jgi:hypothetical protein